MARSFIDDLQTCRLDIDAPLATVRIIPPAQLLADGVEIDQHVELADVFGYLRTRRDVRVIVFTGAGEHFYVPLTPQQYNAPGVLDFATEPEPNYASFNGVIRLQQAMAETEQPIIGRCNGDALGYGFSLLFGCDLIIAREDAQIYDNHMAMDETPDSGVDFGLVPGDGGAALAPLHFPPAKAKEVLMLAAPLDPKELAALGIINRAVPADQLDAVVDEFVTRLLKRARYALAWTKRVANRHLVEGLNLRLDAAAAYQTITLLHRQRQVELQKRAARDGDQ